jgi:hypothetical protein
MSVGISNSFEGEVFKSNLSKGRMGFSGCDINAIIRLPGYKIKGQVLNEEKVFKIGTLQTIAISTYNSKTPVKALGFKSPIAIARGGRTIAGTLIFNQLHTHVFDENNFPSMTRVEDDGLLTYSTGKQDLYISDVLRDGLNSVGQKIDQLTGDAKAGVEKNAEEEAVQPPFSDKEKMKKQWDFSWDNTLFGERSKPSDIPPFDIVILLVNELGNVGKIILYGVDIVHDSQTLSVEDIYTEVQYQFMAREIEYFHAYNFEEARSWSSSASPTTTDLRAKEEAAKTEKENNGKPGSTVESTKESLAHGRKIDMNASEDLAKHIAGMAAKITGDPKAADKPAEAANKTGILPNAGLGDAPMPDNIG